MTAAALAAGVVLGVAMAGLMAASPSAWTAILPWAIVLLLWLPASLRLFPAGLRISGGLALVAEFVAGLGGFASWLAYRILETGYKLQIPRMFATLVLLAAAGIAINVVLGGIAGWLLRCRGEA